MHSELVVSILLASLVLAGSAGAADEAASGKAPAAQSDQVQQAQDTTDRPEYHARPLPADTFTPAESLPEDFPVAFPTDM